MTAQAPILAQPVADELAVVLELGRRARAAADAAELGFLAVNDTHALAPYRQAALWSADRGILALSGLVDVETNAPYAQWLARLCGALVAATAARAVTSAEVPAAADDWPEFLPPYALWLPIAAADGRVTLALLLARDMPWSDRELLLLGEWLDAWGYAYRQQTRDARPSWRARLRALVVDADPSTPWWKRRRTRLAAVALVVCLFPVRLTVLAPAELVPAQPAVMRAPFEGVVDAVLVQPNQRVKRGQPLYRIDTALASSRRDAAVEALAAAEAEYRQAAQQALFDDESRSRLAALQGALEQRRAEADYASGQAARGTVVAPRAGIVLFDDPTSLVGRPVAVGESVMRVADPAKREIEAWVGVGDAIPVEAGARVRLYLDSSPLVPVDGRLRYYAYEAVERPGGSYAYRIRARLAAGEGGRIGLRGTAKLDGDRVPLIYWVFRRPIAAVRAFIGL